MPDDLPILECLISKLNCGVFDQLPATSGHVKSKQQTFTLINCNKIFFFSTDDYSMVKFLSEIAAQRNIEIDCSASLLEYQIGGYFVSEGIPDDTILFLQEVTSPLQEVTSPITVQSNNVTEGRLNTLFVKLSLNSL